ncbi:MAG: Gfo/Idh/MocA family oxidoreductase [Candidatus Omnitrophica bacterium]|nr:Gfo/Idh/MocA family oxidoreductase [Candidatus Omnitrophota bacterium]
MKFRVGIIGCGNIFPMHAQSLSNTAGVELAAVCDIKPARARLAAKKYHCRAYLDYKEMFRKEKLDAVHILTPHHLHPPMAIAALNNKINALSEKPICIDPADGAKMIRAAKNNNVRLASISQNRYNPGSQLVKKNISSGKLGKIKAAKLILTYCKPDSYYKKSDWKGRLATEGGGVLIDQAIHFVDVLAWLVNDEVEYVEANTERRNHKFIEVEDLAEGVIKFRKGALVSFYLMNFYSYDADPEIEIDCQKARVKIVKDSARIGFYSGGALEAKPYPNEYIDYGDGWRDYWGYCHWIQIKDFYQALKEGRQPPVSPGEAIKTQEIVWNIYKSARLRRRIYFN